MVNFVAIFLKISLFAYKHRNSVNSQQSTVNSYLVFQLSLAIELNLLCLKLIKKEVARLLEILLNFVVFVTIWQKN